VRKRRAPWHVSAIARRLIIGGVGAAQHAPPSKAHTVQQGHPNCVQCHRDGDVREDDDRYGSDWMGCRILLQCDQGRDELVPEGLERGPSPHGQEDLGEVGPEGDAEIGDERPDDEQEFDDSVAQVRKIHAWAMCGGHY